MINCLSFKILSMATKNILAFPVSLPSHEHYRFCIKYVLKQDMKNIVISNAHSTQEKLPTLHQIKIDLVKYVSELDNIVNVC